MDTSSSNLGQNPSANRAVRSRVAAPLAAGSDTKAADEIGAVIEPVTQTFLDLTLAGQKADS